MKGRKIKIILMLVILVTISTTSLSLNKIVVNASSNKSGTMKVKVLSKSNRTAECMKVDSEQEVIKIPNLVIINGKTYKVVKIGNKALANNKTVTKVICGKYVTTIGNDAFRNCKKLETVCLESQGLKKIGKNAFRGDKNLTKIFLNSTKMNKKSVGTNALKGTNKKLTVEVISKKKASLYKKVFAKKGNNKVKVKKHSHKYEKGNPIYGDKWVEGETHMFDYAITEEMWKARYGENCTDKSPIYEQHRGLKQYVSQYVHDLFPEHYPIVGAWVGIDMTTLIKKYNDMNGTNWTTADMNYAPLDCDSGCYDIYGEMCTTLPPDEPQRHEKIINSLCERCQSQWSFMDWIKDVCEIKRASVNGGTENGMYHFYSLYAITGYKERGHYEIIGYEQECECGKTKNTN